eukprot:Blabericola_migrator_1__3067@NODE_1896_length_3595_cov_19_177154_g1214_i0_p2_GENE_NODE_1896_length_3595_cov_19_177154_g1214_i0NODE_1896_length_3595_cov_19_177154_g1214_i0_p2_ORF_typecomplete_len159_score27_67TPP_enzyme_M/PF00205_22/0_00033_NODE_1896_length_3595_cov_19_177154_g1214_i08321308
MSRVLKSLGSYFSIPVNGVVGDLMKVDQAIGDALQSGRGTVVWVSPETLERPSTYRRPKTPPVRGSGMLDGIKAELVTAFCDMLIKAEKPLFLVGTEIVRHDLTDVVHSLASLTHDSVICMLPPLNHFLNADCHYFRGYPSGKVSVRSDLCCWPGTRV